MESGFLTIILVSTFEVYSSHSGVRDWEDVMVAREGMPTTLVCTDTIVRGAVAINWMVKSLDEWKLVLSASESKKFSGGASKASTRLTDPNFQDTGVFSLFLVPRMEDSGLYSCLIKQQERKLKEKIILLAILTVTVLPAAPIPQLSTVRLAARVNPGYAVKITWAAPGGIYMKSKKTNTDTVTKLPLVQNKDGGTYVCMVHPWGNSSNTVFAFDVDVTVDAYSVASFTNITYETEISTATRAQTLFPLTCPGVQGDYVRLHWLPPDSKKHSEVELVYQNDSWGGLTFVTKHNKRLQLAGPPYNAEAGSFSFLLTPELKDGGLYICEVFLNDIAVSRRTTLSVLTATVKTRHSSSKLELWCLYSELSQVHSARWKYQNESRHLHVMSKTPGRIATILPLPITSDTAGNYTCSLQLNNGRTVWATHAVTLPRERVMDVEGVSVTTPSLLPSLSALLLLVPLVAAAVCVLLWRQKHISDRGEAENIYENPEDIRQAPSLGSVYMDLKPRGEDDVYKELERC
ncbi:g6f-like isoform X2 [Pseudoliparis swirei]|uniref:g6f-like isoform X2 n=1 Tax=Pseudoliparis swirei TaxID=2059687 RepID=UPI0024BED09D|nr:g6f-like isoform X2 [Pseudoliparis swirei]